MNIPIPDDVHDIQPLIESYLPKIKIEQLLIEVDKSLLFFFFVMSVNYYLDKYIMAAKTKTAIP